MSAEPKRNDLCEVSLPVVSRWQSWILAMLEGGTVSADVRGYVVDPGVGVSGSGPDVKATAALTAGALTVMESKVTQGPPRHVHAHEDECFYVLAGTVVVSCGDDVFDARPRSFVFLPRGIPHTFHAADDQAEVLFFAVPGGIEHYFAEINNAVGVAEQERIGAKYDIRVV